MQDRAAEPGVQLVGREAELEALHEFLGADRVSGALVLAGPPGMGKTTLWETGLAAAQARGLRVLSARPNDVETRLAFAALIDLLDGVDSAELAGLAAPQLHALEVALLRAEPTGAPPEERAIAVGLLNALRALAAGGPVLVAVDDAQWLDAPSAEALAFAGRRLEGDDIRFLLTRRAGTPPALESTLARSGLERVELGPLSLGATRRLLSLRLGLSLSRHLLRRILESTLGNPLFALELGRTLAEHGPHAIGDELPVPKAVEDLLGTRVAGLAGPARRLLLAVALSGDLRASQAAAIAEPAALADAVAAGVLLVDGDRVRPSHPLFGAAARSRASAGEQRDVHLELAGVLLDEEVRARHLALGTEHADPELAATVASAARSASARGASQEAAVLAEHALRLTPPEDDERTGRLLALAEYLVIVGEPRRAAELLSRELESLRPGAQRVRAYMLLASDHPAGSDDLERYQELALAESGSDPELRAAVLVQISNNDAVIRVERIGEAEAHALEALRVAPGDQQLALYALAWARSLRGRPIDDLCERFRAVSDAAAYMVGSPERVAGQRLVWRGEVRAAAAILTPLMSAADERGEPVSYALQRLHVCELELRTGEWEAAAHLLDEWAESSEKELLVWPMYERCRALLAAGRGLADEAERWAGEAIAGAEATGVRWDLLEALRARGIAALLAHEPARAAESLRAVWEHTRREGVDDPGAFPAAPDLVEALLELGEQEEAQAVTERLRALAEDQDHPWGLVTARRCAALVRLTSAWDEQAASELADAASGYGRLGLRFDRARTLLVLGRAQRRLKKWRAARESLERATAAFEELGSPGWSDEARSELTRVGARRPRPSGELTPAERRVAELAAGGFSNKEIARTLFVAVHTVEAHLSHAYAKLGVRSRAQLGPRLTA